MQNIHGPITPRRFLLVHCPPAFTIIDTMNLFYDICYFCTAPVVVPFLFFKSLRTGKYRSDWPARFGRVRDEPPPGQNMRRLLLHCVSVGELASMRLLIDRLLAGERRLFIILTTTTDTGTARAREIYDTPRYDGRVAAYRYPLDLSFAVESFLDHTRPDAIALVELETWPNFISIAAARRIPIAVINGRLTQRSANRYALIQPVIAAMLNKINWFGIQTETIAKRFVWLGAPAEKIEVIPTLKYDAADFSDIIPGQRELADATGIRAWHSLFVGGSTGAGEETALLDSYTALRGQYPALRLAIAPRQPTTVPLVEDAVKARGLFPILRSKCPDGTQRPELTSSDVLIVDTFGELKKLYNLANCVFVGRSLVKLGGSDMIEAAALAKPLCFGPHTHNFSEVVELLLAGNAAAVVNDAAELTAWVDDCQQFAPAAKAAGLRARSLIAQQCGSTEYYVKKLLGMCAASPASLPQMQRVGGV